MGFPTARAWLAGVVVVLGLASGLPAWADDADDCNSDVPDQVIRGCSGLIAAGAGGDKNVAAAYNNRGGAHSDKGDFDRAIADYTRAIALDPTFAFAYYNRGNAYSDKGDPDGAIADYDQAIALDPGYARAHYNRAIAYNDKGDLDRAIADFGRVIALDPAYANAYRSRCWLRAVAGRDLPAARKDCDRALELATDAAFRAMALDSRGLVGLKEGSFLDAYVDYDMAIQGRSDNAHALYGRAIASLRMGREADGRAGLARALELAPDIASRYAGYGIEP